MEASSERDRLRRSKTSGPGIGGAGSGPPTIGASHSVVGAARNSKRGPGSTSCITPSADSRAPVGSCRTRYIAKVVSPVSSGLQGSGTAPSSRYSKGGAASASNPAPTPSAYTSISARSPSPSAASARRERARKRCTRAARSVGSAAAPNSAASSPAALRRRRSIWKKRSCACRKPVTRATSSRPRARIVGTPSSSRSTTTGAVRPGSTTVPSSTGALACSWW